MRVKPESDRCSHTQLAPCQQAGSAADSHTTWAFLDCFGRQSKLRWLAFGVVFALLLGVIDYQTGNELSFSIFYLVPIALLTWFSGRLMGVLTSFVCATIWLEAELLWMIHYSHPTIPYWNALVRLGFFLITVVLLSRIRTLNEHLKDLVAERTAGLTAEIAVRRQTEEGLRESEERFRLMVESVKDYAIFMLDLQGRVLSWNSGASRFYGYRADEILGRHVSSFFSAEDVQNGKPDRELRATLAHGTFTEEGWRVRQDGSQFWAHVVVTLLHDASNRVRGFVKVARDLTEARRAEKQAHELRLAGAIQQQLLPSKPPALAGFDIGGLSRPATATGGDYFDYIPMADERMEVIIADVSGHGLGPALLMAETRAYFRAFALMHTDPNELMVLLNRVLANDIGQGRFVTLLLLQIDPRTRSLVYIGAGHPPGHVLDRFGAVRQVLKSVGPPLGLQADWKYLAPPPEVLAPGEIVVLLTDGVLESSSLGGTSFGLERALEIVHSNRNRSATEIADALCTAVQTFLGTETQADDVTVVIIKVLD